MKFIDEAIIKVKAGKGGDGICAFHRELFLEKGGPSGGNGGNGGSVILVGNKGLNTLREFHLNRHLKANNGENGKNKSKHGKNSPNSYYQVPLGTIVKDNNGNYLGEITKDKEELIIAHGGRGGRGNKSFKSNKNQAPTFCEKGLNGEEKELKLELKIMADCGLIGFPNVGKSTLISTLSNNKPKIANYPFTTLAPSLGVVYYKDLDIIMADLPGLIENAHLGLGLGIQFLKHIERCRILIHILDATNENPKKDYEVIQNELKSYDNSLLNKPQVLVINKIDSISTDKLNKLKKEFPKAIFISAYTKFNLDKLLEEVFTLYNKLPPVTLKDEIKLINKIKDNKNHYSVIKEDGVYKIKGTTIESLFQRTDFSNDVSMHRFSYQLRKMGVDYELRKKGAKSGDTIVILDYEFIFYD